ncbi:MAG: phosphoribosyl-ATP diphosphatase, partial [Deltaproteobacteria bacterium]
KRLCRLHECRVGGGIRDIDTARRWLEAGARRIVVGTAATPELLSRLPRERVVVALDCRRRRVVVDGWRSCTGRDVAARMAELAPLAGGFLVTVVEREGRLAGADMELAAELKKFAGDARLVLAGGISTAREIAALDEMGIDAQVGLAIYDGTLELADAVAAPLRTDRPDGLWATVVCDEGYRALGLAWSNRQSLSEALRTRRGVYWSRKRGLWRKGETSGCGQELVRVALDCDRDALMFVVRQHGRGFCHLERDGCWGDLRGLAALQKRIAQRFAERPETSYTAKLFDDPGLLEAKLAEEAQELAAARERDEVTHEAADLLYFAMAKLCQAGVRLEDVERELDRRAAFFARGGRTP